MLCRRIGFNEWKVTPLDGPEHTIKRVSFIQVGKVWMAKCEAYKTGRQCDANSFGNNCAHVFRVAEQLRINEVRRRNREKKAA